MKINTLHEGIGAAMKKNVESETGMVRVSLGAGAPKAAGNGPAYLKPGQTMSFQTEGVQLGGVIRLLRLGSHPNIELVSASINGGKEEISKKQLEEGFPIEVMQKIMITVKNKDEGRLLWAHPFFRISEEPLDCLVTAEVIEQRQGTIHLGSDQAVRLTTEIPFLMKLRRIFIHSFSADEEYLVVEDVRAGKNSVFANSSSISAAHFSERLSPIFRLGTLQPGQLFSVHLRNRGPSTIAFTAEVEGSKVET